MNKLMQNEKIRLSFIILSVLNLYLAKQIYFISESFFNISIFYPESFAILISIILLCLLSIYFIIKVIWQEKIFTFNKTPGYKLFATGIMLLSIYSGIYILEYTSEMYKSYARNIYGTTAIYMIAVAIVTACFIAEINLSTEVKKE